MFTGIVETTGKILELHDTPGGLRLSVDLSSMSSKPAPGDSVAIDGVCLTVVSCAGGKGDFDVIRETIDRTVLSDYRTGHLVNLECSMGPTTRFDGHFVQGHIDAVARVDNVMSSDEEWVVWCRHERELQPLIVPKGSIALNGVSLTLAKVEPGRFSVALIPTTVERTNLGRLTIGARVNLETDILARTVHHQLKAILGQPDPGNLQGILQEHGFV